MEKGVNGYCRRHGRLIVDTAGKCEWCQTFPDYPQRICVQTPHKCPVCDGTGLVSRPPGVAGEQREWTDNQTKPYSCRACDGKGLLWA